MQALVPDQVLRVGGAADLAVTWEDQNGTVTAPSGAVTVRVTRADGTDLVPVGSSTTGTNPYYRALTAAQNAALDQLTATWTAAIDGTVRETVIDIVGGHLFSIAEAREFDETLKSAEDYSDEDILRVRREVDEELTEITGWAFTPRYRRVRLNGTGEGSLAIPDAPIRTVRSVRTYSSPVAYTTFSDDALEGLSFDELGRITREPGYVFERGLRNIVIEYEHGHTRPPEELKHAALARLRYRLNMEKSLDSAGAMRFLDDGNGNLVAVDAELPIEQRQVFRVYRRHSRSSEQASSGVLEYQPQRDSLFHGGRR